MDSPGYIMLSRLGAELRGTQVLANNIANADTPGFRAERAVFAEFLQLRAGGALPGDRGAAYAIDRATWRDTAAGYRFGRERRAGRARHPGRPRP